MAICLNRNGISAASVRRPGQGLPEVEWAFFLPMTNASASSSHDSLMALATKIDTGRYSCINLLAKDEYQVSLLEAPNIPQDEWKTAIRWRLKDLLDFSVTEATIDVLPIPVDQESTGQVQSLYAIAANNQIIKQRQALFEAAQIPLAIIDIPEMAQRNIASLVELPDRAMALLFFDELGGLLTITYAGELYMARRIEISASQILLADAEQQNATFERLTVELQRTLDHFERQFRHIGLSKVLLGPMGTATAALQRYLSSNLYVPVEILMLDQIFDISRVPALKDGDFQQQCFLALGAALRSEGKRA